MNRRAFLKLLVVGAVGAALPTVPIFVGECSTRRPFQHVAIRQRKLMARIRISGEVLRDSVNRPPGSFVQYCRAEHARVLREAAEQFARLP